VVTFVKFVKTLVVNIFDCVKFVAKKLQEQINSVREWSHNSNTKAFHCNSHLRVF